MTKYIDIFFTYALSFAFFFKKHLFRIEKIVHQVRHFSPNGDNCISDSQNPFTSGEGMLISPVWEQMTVYP